MSMVHVLANTEKLESPQFNLALIVLLMATYQKTFMNRDICLSKILNFLFLLESGDKKGLMLHVHSF